LPSRGPGTRSSSSKAATLVSAVALIAFSSIAEAQYVRVAASSFSTSSATFTDVPGSTLSFTPGSASDVWILLLSGRVRSTWTTSDEIAAETRYLVNGTQRGLISIRNHGANAGGTFAHFDRVTGTTAPQIVKVQLRDGKATATLDNLRILAFRLPSGADFQFADTIGVQSVPALVWTSMQSLTFTPASAGNYLVMALSSGRENPDNSTLAVRLQDAAGAFWPVDDLPVDPRQGQFENGRSGWPPFFLARVQNLTATAKTYSIEAQGDALGAEIRDTRIMAFRTDAFDNVQSVEDTPTITTTSTTPVVKSTLNTTAPPAARDYIIIQNLLLDADVSSTDERRAGFERNDTVVASYGLVSTNNEFESSYALFDAVTTASPMKLENTFSTSNAAYSVDGKESAIHVLRLASTSCCDLQTTEGAGTLTVTAPESFEMRFNTARGGGMDEFFDLAEDPSRVHDLAGKDSINVFGLFHSSMIAGGLLYTTGTNSTNAKLDLLEATATRVKVRQESFYQRVLPATAILPGVKGIGDYSVYGPRVAIRWNRKTTAAVLDQDDYPLEIAVHREAAGVLNPMVLYSQSGSVFPAPAGEDFVLAQREVTGGPGVRTDFLAIQHADWPAADTLTASITGMYFSWRDNTLNQNLPAGLDEKWNLLVYYKPTNFLDNTDLAVTSRRDDYRAPSAITGLGPGTQWQDVDENTSAVGDFFNESEAAYVFDLDPMTGLTFDIDGSATRYSPFFKIRQWQSMSPPATITVESVTKVRNVHYKADVKPVSRAHFAQDLLWYSTIENSAALATPNVGNPGSSLGITFVPGRFGLGLDFSAANSYIQFPTTDFDKVKGAVEFWVKPYYDSTDGLESNLAGFRAGPNDEWVLRKATDNSLNFIITASGITSQLTISSANYSWRANDWVHVRMEWDDSAPLATQQRIFLNGTEPAHIDPAVDYASAGLSLNASFRVGSYRNGAPDAAGLYDEVYSFGGSAGTPTALAHGGLVADPSEYLADVSKNFPLSFAAVSATRQGEYLHFGADSKFRGLNVGLATAGIGTGLDLAWEYWNGATWADLESGFGFADITNNFTRTGTVYWTSDPTGWAPYSVKGDPDLYYVRARLATGSYSQTPIEALIKTDILLFQYCEDVSLGSQTFVFAPPIPTAVTLSSFSAVARDSAAELSWTTGSELQNLGFHLYRADSEDGPYARITAAVIPGLGSSPHGASYSYVDSGLSNGATYFYKLEDIETTGKTTLHGPVSATPSSDASPPTSTPTSLITYGNPEGNAFRILRQSAHGVVLELVTEGFHAEPREDGTVRISVPGFEPMNGASIPVLRPWVEASVGRNVVITSVDASSVESFTGLRPAGAEALEIVATREGTVRAGRRPRRAFLGTAGLFPEEAARLLQVGFQGDVKKAQLELAPLRWNGSTGELLFARRLTVHLAFRGMAANERGHRERASHGARNLLARLTTTEKGLYEVRYEDVFRTGRGVGLSQLRLSRLGEPVAFHIEPRGARFAPGSRLYFLSEGGDANPYAREAIYELELGAGGLVMELGSASPWGEEHASYLQTDEYEENRFYQAGLLEAPDLWLWDVLMAPSTKSFSFEANGLRSGSSRLTAWLQGVSDFNAHPDHHLRVYVNGAFQQELFWDGKESRKADLVLSPGILREGENHLEIENVGDTEAPYSMVMLDRFQVVYPRTASAEGGSFAGSWPLSGTASAQELGTSHLLDVTEETPRWLSGAEISADGSIHFRAEAGRSYMAVSHDAVRHPSIRSATRPRLKKETLGADYLVIAPREFSATAAPLLAHRSRQGLRVKLASLQDVYDEFGFGETRPEAIRDFLSYAYHHWQGPKLRYVLLLGDATYDFKDFLQTGVTNKIPPLMVKTSYLWTVSDPALGAIHGDDILPDVAIGRLPARNPDELRVMVSKILAYETGEASLESLLVLINDNPDGAGDFARNTEEIAAGVLSRRPLRRLSLDELGGSMRNEILRAFDEGASLVSYVGHGGIHLWADENVLNIGDVASLSPQSQQPLLLTMNCLNGYFHFPYFDSLAETFVKAEGKGAVAAFSPSGLSLNEPAHRFHQALLDAVFNQGHQRLGDAVLAAQEEYAESGAFPELLSIYHLLGDPGLTLR